MSAAYLLDVNVLIALTDPGHEFHTAARRWRDAHVHLGWATCPLTENALIRILSQRNYIRSMGSAEDVLTLLRALRNGRGHEFWSDEVSFADAELFPSLSGVSSAQLTDLYLLGLAASRNARFATFDQRIAAESVVGGPGALEIVSTSR